MVLVAILVATALILVNAVYVAAEFAAVSVRQSRLRQLADDGNPFARWLLPWLVDAGGARSLHRRLPDRHHHLEPRAGRLRAVHAGGLADAAAGQRSAACSLSRPQSTAAVIVLLVLTAAQVIFGELVPKSLALQYPTPSALYTLPADGGSLWIYRPFIRWLNGSGLLLLRLLGAPQQAHRHIHSPDEIELLIAESRDGGLLEPDEHRRLQRALRLNLRQAKQLMVPRTRIAALEVDTPMDGGDRRRGREPLLAAARLPRLARQHRRRAAHQGPGALAGAGARGRRDARQPEPADQRRARERHRRPRAAPACASGARTRRSWWTSSAARRARDAAGRAGRVPGRGGRRVQGRRAGRRADRRTGQVRLPGSMAVVDEAAALDAPLESDATTVERLRDRSARPRCRCRATRSRSTATRSGSKRVADRAIESVVATRVAPAGRRGRDGMSELLVPFAIIAALALANALFVAAEFAIVGAPRANVEHRRAQGRRLARTRGADPAPTRGGRTATSPPPSSASRSPASASGMYGEHVLADYIAPWLDAARTDAAGSPRTRWPAASRSACSPTSTSWWARWCPRGWRCSRPMRTALLRVAGHRGARDRAAAARASCSTAPATGCCADRHQAQRERGRALSHQRGAAVHRRGEPRRRAAARRVRAHPARAVRVRRPDRGRGDGAAGPPGRASAAGRPSTTCRRSSAAHPHTRYPIYPATWTTSWAACTSRTCCAQIVAGAR